MPLDIRVDPLTGVKTVHSHLAGKPLPRIERILNSVEPCPFCALTDGHPEQGTGVTDTDGVTRVVLVANRAAIVIPNRWSVLAPSGDPADGHSEVHVSRPHVTALEELSVSQAADLGGLLWSRRVELGKSYESVSAIVNVGVNAGGSVAHLHGQVNASGVPGSLCGHQSAEGCAVCLDVDEARKSGLLVASEGELQLYAPAAPGCAGELRIAFQECASWSSDTAGHAFVLAHRLLSGLSRSGLAWPYNLILHGGAHPHLHVLPRVDFGLVYQIDFGLIPIGNPIAPYAQTLRELID